MAILTLDNTSQFHGAVASIILQPYNARVFACVFFGIVFDDQLLFRIAVPHHVILVTVHLHGIPLTTPPLDGGRVPRGITASHTFQDSFDTQNDLVDCHVTRDVGLH